MEEREKIKEKRSPLGKSGDNYRNKERRDRNFNREIDDENRNLSSSDQQQQQQHQREGSSSPVRGSMKREREQDRDSKDYNYNSSFEESRDRFGIKEKDFTKNRREFDRNEESPPRKRGRRDDFERRDWQPRRNMNDEGEKDFAGRDRNFRDRERSDVRVDKSLDQRDREKEYINPRYRRDSGRRGGGFRELVFAGNLKSIRQFTEFIQWEDPSVRDYEIQHRYDDYKREWNKRNSRKFFDEHCQGEWFKERYLPEMMEKRRILKIERAKQEVKLFNDEIINGNFKYNIDADDHPELLSSEK